MKTHAWNATMSESHYIFKTDASGVGLSTTLVQVRDNLNCRYHETLDNVVLWPIAFASINLSSIQHWYNNIEREALGILHGLDKFHY